MIPLSPNHLSFVLAIMALSANVAAQDGWYLLARHGECARVTTLVRKVPYLGTTSDPSEFVKLVEKSGHTAVVKALPIPEGKAYEINVPSLALAVVFVTPNLCKSFLSR